MPRCPSWRLIVRHAIQGRQPLTGFRRGWFFMIKPTAAYAIRLSPEAQVWVAEEGQGWRRSLVRERGILWHRCCAELDPDERETAEQRQAIARAACNRRHLEALFNTLPSVQQSLVRQLKGDDGFLVLKFAQASRESLDLLLSNPGLGYLLATACRHSPKIRWDHAIALAGQRQRVILQALGFPPSERLRKLFMRLPMTLMCVQTVKTLRHIFTHREVLPLVAGVQKLTQEVAQWLRHREHWHLYTPRLISELSQQGEPEEQYFCFPHIVTLAEAAKAGHWQPRPLLSYAHSRKMVAALPRPPRPRESLPCALPAPPCPGDESITPLTTDHALAAEGEQMRHCLGSPECVSSALAGASAYYRVLTPQRCTLALQRLSSGGWKIGCLKLAENRDPNRETVDAVETKFTQWLGRAFVSRQGPPQGNGASLSLFRQ